MTTFRSPLAEGEVLGGKYRIDRVIGGGSMGVVVAARHIELNRRLAIKFMLSDPDSDSVLRFQREGRAAALLRGDHSTRVYDLLRPNPSSLGRLSIK